ncbi:MAG: hypothetical protein RQ750_16410 [Roseovarius sp.]|nr:hypothetical protein [Roseovarius sp.]
MALVVFVTLVGSLAYLVYSLRRSIQTLRGAVIDLVGEGTLATRLLPNLAFFLLFALLLSQSMQSKMPLPVSNFLGLGTIHSIYEFQESGRHSSVGIASIKRNMPAIKENSLSPGRPKERALATMTEAR